MPTPPFLVESLILLTTGAATTATTTSSGPLHSFEVRADRLYADLERKVYRAEGSVVLKRPGVLVMAERILFDERAQLAVAEGDVILVEGRSLLRCQRIEMQLPELRGGLEAAELEIKSGISPQKLASEVSAGRVDSLRARNELMLTADRVDRSGPRSFVIEGGFFSPCDCGPDPPSWHIESSTAHVDLDSGIWLMAPVFYASELPVFVLPVFYVPVGGRRTGLLLPRLGYGPTTGFRGSEPLYWAIDRSWDATLEPGYYSGRGFVSDVELRWAPGERSSGQVRLTMLFDQGIYDPVDGWHPGRDTPIFRFAVTGEHQQQWEDSTLAVEINTTGDPGFVRELGDDFLDRQVEEAVSRATLTTTGLAGVRAAVGLSLRQDLRAVRYRGSGRSLREISLFSADRPGPGDIRYRLFDLRIDAPLAPVVGDETPIFGDAALVAQAFLAPSSEVARFARVDLRPSLMVPLDLGGVLVLEPSIALRMTGWSGRIEGGNESHGRLALIGKTSLFTELWRWFGSIKHRVRPEVVHLLIPAVSVSGPGENRFLIGDEVDLLSRAHQIAASLETDVSTDDERLFWLKATLGRGLPLPDQPEETATHLLLKGELGLDETRLSARASFDLEAGRLEELRAGLDLRALSWLRLTMSAGAFGDEPPRTMLTLPEEIIPSSLNRSRYVSSSEWEDSLRKGDTGVLPWSSYQGIAGAVSIRPLAPLLLVLRGNIQLEPSPLDQSGSPVGFRSMGALVRWDSPCECWGAQVQVSIARDQEGPTVLFDLDLARLGSSQAVR